MMSEQQFSSPKTPRNAANWAKPVETLSVGAVSDDALNLNV